MLPLSPSLLCDAFFWMLRVSPITGSFPQPLSAAQENAALQAMQNGDSAARDRLIEHNLRLVAHVVKKYYTSREDQDDLISIGTIGLIKAVSTFQPDRNIRLATYACRCIENAILTRGKKLRSAVGGQVRTAGRKNGMTARVMPFSVKISAAGDPARCNTVLIFCLRRQDGLWRA